MKKTAPEPRIGFLKEKTLKDIIYILICVTIVTAVGIQLPKRYPQPISPIPQAEAFNLLHPITLNSPLGELPVADDNWTTFMQECKRLAPIYDFPVKVMIAQAALESQRGHSEYAVNRNNYFGIAAYDWNPDDAYSYDNADQSIISYMQLIRDRFPEAYAARKNPGDMIRLLVNNSQGVQYATDPDYVSKLESLPEWSQN